MKILQKPQPIPIRKTVFWPPFLLIGMAMTTSLLRPDIFAEAMNNTNKWLLNNFSLAFSYVAFFMVVTCALIYFSPLGKIKIGGKEAQPRFNNYSWFSIILCTTVAVGILFWGSAEPLFHFLYPPSFVGAFSGSDQAAKFAMGAVFLHWGFTPYAIYSIPALGVALAIYNSQSKFSLASPLIPITGHTRLLPPLLDMICLFSLVAGMAASLGAGILSISGGIRDFWNTLDKGFMLPMITLAIIASFILSASTGINKGIKNLSKINLYFFIVFSLFIFMMGPSLAILGFSKAGLQQHLNDYFQISLQQGPAGGSEWVKSWSVFNWANWMAWAPITALFLGKIAYGRTVREFLLFNWILPAIFCLTWMSIFGGSTLYYALENPTTFQNLLEQSGPEAIIYRVFEHIGYIQPLATVFIIAMFISYVTAADSSTEAMASLSMKSFSVEKMDAETSLKIVWGSMVGFLAWVMISFADIEGIKMLSNLGGLPSLFLLLAITISLNRTMWHPDKHFKKKTPRKHSDQT